MGSMKDQLGDQLYAGRLYPETSRAAFESIKPVSGALDRAIIDAIKAAPAGGITCDQIEHVIGRSHQAVSGNLRHLVERKSVKASGEYGLTSSGRRAQKWVMA